MLIRLVDSFLPTLRTSEQLARSRLLVGLLLFGLVLSYLMGLLRWQTEGPAIATLVVLGTATMLLALLAAFRFGLPVGVTADLTMAVIGIAITSIAWHDHGLYSRAMIWLPTIPLLANFIGERFRSFAAAVLVAALLLTLDFGHRSGAIAGPLIDDSRTGRMAAFFASTLLVSLIAHIYERNRRQADTQRRRYEALQRQWVSMVSHELRTPLTALQGSLMLGLNKQSEALPAELKTLLQIAQRNTERLVRLVNDLLDVERISAGHLVLNIGTANLAELLENTVVTFADIAAEKQITLQVQCDTPAELTMDADRILQVIHNLVANAIKFSTPGQPVRLHTFMQPSAVRVEVSNQGSGIDADLAPRLFLPFSQASHRDNRQYGGFGLGLNICRAIIEQHGGQIGFRNLTPPGCVFYFELPQPPRPPKPR